MRAAGATHDVLPAEVTTYVGRRAELSELRRLLGVSPVVTLTGPGGVGKTRLAQRAAAAVRAAFPGGLAFVELADLREPQLLVDTVAQRLGLGDRAARPRIDVLVDHLRGRRLLLVLDNCEHLVAACAQFVSTLTTSCPDLVVLATSRQSLAVAGEHVLPVPPLTVEGSSPALLAQSDAVRLFVDRATAVVPSFRLTEDNTADVARLCRALDGLPLAIELAAVRLRSLSVGQLADRLDKRFTLLTTGGSRGPSRHGTLRSLVDWSHELCTEQERLLWARASVFSGTFDLDAAEAVCSGDGLDTASVLDVIDRLLDKSILHRDDVEGVARYRMLETMRQYGAQRLRAAGDTEHYRRRHRDWFFELTRRFEAEWISPAQVTWISRLRREHANLRVALEFCATAPDEAAVGLRGLPPFKEYWIITGLTEGRLWLDKLLGVTGEDTPSRAHVLWIYAFYALVQGDLPAMERALAAATETADRDGDESALAYVDHVRAYAALIGNDMATAATLFETAIRSFREQGDRPGELWSTFNHGLALSLSGHYERGRRILRDSIATLAANGELFWRSWALWSLSAAEYLHGDIADATGDALEMLRLQRQVHDKVILAFGLTVLAGCATRSDEPRRAARLLGAATTVWQTLGATPNNYAAFVEPRNRDVDTVTGQLGVEDAAAEFLAGTGLSTEDAVAYALGEVPAEPDAAVPFRSPLTKRETQIAELVAMGMTNREIAERLVISRRTAETHVDHILGKLGYTNRAQIAAWFTDRHTPPA
ncbi:ATP-binding protein [Amycolatopsis suaedae]|uniref:ATP-binding protein n=1 Tax=Amycolatopsis suaedae TaxID=2510978 RepID=UPI001F0F05E1|nr:LuxR C-terminal-related transcriptional regulator [Amycolatopsis suaedae]